MKKTFSRVLSLVLVLAMFVSAVPLTMADNEVVTYETFNITCPSVGFDKGYFYVPIGAGPIALSGTGTPSNANEALTWSADNTAAFTIEGNMMTPIAPGSSPVRVYDSDGNELDNTSFWAGYFPRVASSEVSVNKDASVNLPVVTVPGLNPDQYSVTWDITEGSDLVTLDGTTVTGEAAGTATATATVSAPSIDANHFPYTTVTCAVVVSDAPTYAATIESQTVEVTVGETKDLPAITVPGLAVTAYDVVWSDQDNGEFDISGKKVTGVAKGTSKAKVTITGKNGETINPSSFEVTIDVKDAAITLELADKIEVAKGSEITLKKPTLKGAGHSNYEVTAYTYAVAANDNGKTVNSELKSSGTGSNKVWKLTGKAAGRDWLTVTATVKHKTNGSELTVEALTVPVSVYTDTQDITVILKDTAKTYRFDNFSSVVSMAHGENKITVGDPDANNGNNNNWTLDMLLADMRLEYGVDRGTTNPAAYVLKFKSLSAEGGELDRDEDSDVQISALNTGVALDSLPYVEYTRYDDVKTRSKFSYTIYDDKNMIMVQGVLIIDYQGNSQIQYNTDFETPVTFQVADFQKFWVEYGTNKELFYITFNSLPSSTYGKLWTSPDKVTAVTTKQKFAEFSYTSSSYYDLNTVTFVPGSRTTAYSVSIPFTAVDASGATVPGTITISVSKGTTSNVTSLGMAFGNASYKLDDKIAEAFKKANDNEILDYVTFTLPAAEHGKLYYNFKDFSSLIPVYSSDKFHYNPASTEKVDDLAKVAFIPAAGYSGNVRISYTATGEDGTVYNGHVTLKVTAKSKSQYFTDVKSGSYAWASDAVDFLRYHGIVNGTNDANTEFSPANSITRAHFMLMLYRAFLADEYKNFNVTSNFPDITKGTSAYQKELYQAVGVAKYLGITNGVDGKYLPNKNITREEAMTLIYRTLDIMDKGLSFSSKNTYTQFTDFNKVSAYAKDPLKYLISHGVVLGTDGKINPKSNITRAEMAVILHRILTY